MTMHVEIPESVAQGLEALVAATGTTPEEVALTAIKRELAGATLDEILAPARTAFEDQE